MLLIPMGRHLCVDTGPRVISDLPRMGSTAYNNTYLDHCICLFFYFTVFPPPEYIHLYTSMGICMHHVYTGCRLPLLCDFFFFFFHGFLFIFSITNKITTLVDIWAHGVILMPSPVGKVIGRLHYMDKRTVLCRVTVCVHTYASMC